MIRNGSGRPTTLQLSTGHALQHTQGHKPRFFATLLAPTFALAFQPLLTDDTGTRGTGGNQLEFSWNEDQATRAGTATRTHSVPLVYTRGLTAALNVFVQGNEGGSGNPSFGFK